MRNIFLEKLSTKYNGKTISTPFLKKIKIEHISGSIVFVFNVCEVEDYRKYFETFTSYKVFSKDKKKPRTRLPAPFSAWFLKKNISLVVFYYLTKFHCLVAFTLLGIGLFVDSLLTSLWCDKFWNQPYLSYQALFSI